MIIMIDNYDSFTYNLFQYMGQIGTDVRVFRNDKISVADIEEMKPSGIVISPGPGRPESAGITLSVVAHFSGRVPILGVCLGHQSIAQAFGGTIVSAKRLMHGKTSMIEADGRAIYQGIKKPFQAMRYHSLAVNAADLPGCFHISARSQDGEIMGIRHKDHPTEGIQFHPESIMTPLGKRMLRNFLSMAEDGASRRDNDGI